MSLADSAVGFVGAALCDRPFLVHLLLLTNKEWAAPEGRPYRSRHPNDLTFTRY